MLEKIWNIKNVEEKVASNGNAYLSVTVLGDDGKDHKSTVFDASMFPIFKNNKAVKVQLEKPDGKTQWQVRSVVSVAEQLQPAVNPNDTPIPQQGEVAAVVNTDSLVRTAGANVPDARTLDIHRQVAVKEIGELWRCGHITENEAVNKKLIAWYMNWIYRTVGIDVHYE
ncbi:hypothetical protein LCGC14_0561210 [marine sediment metagenome]|uniref:Uncharacterized protein n=1 Tax=marine sediment metagenome TaxID=412755 RepID=A0A0F9RLY1_9ZZZZ